MRIFLLVILASVLSLSAAEPPSWPKAVRELTDSSFVPTKASKLPQGISLFHREESAEQRANREVGLLWVDLDGDGVLDLIVRNDEGGSGGTFYTIYQMQKGGYRSIGVFQGFRPKLLTASNGYLQIEAWSRGGGLESSRDLYRFERGEYRCVREDNYRTDEEKGKIYVGTNNPQ